MSGAAPEATRARCKAPFTLPVALAGLAGLATQALCAPEVAAETPAYPQGAAAFQANCAVCHGAAGAGIASLAPPLSSYPARYAASPEGRRQLAMTVLYGMIGDITVGEARFNSQMPDFARLDDGALATILNFVVFDVAHAPADVKPLGPDDIAAERVHPMDGAAVREHRKSLGSGGP